MTVRPIHLLDVALAVGIIVVVVGVSQPSQPTVTATEPGPQLRPGQSLVIRGHEWASAERHAVLIVDLACPACEANLPFYRLLLRQVDSRPDLNVIVLSTEAGQQVREWLDNNEGRNPLVARASSLARLGVTGTPTVLIVDSSGTITDMSVGALEAGEQQRFVGRLMNDVGEPLASKDFRTDEVTGVDLAAISDRGAIQFVDVGDREAFRLSLRENVVNIPIDELEIRAPNELSRSQPIVLDASHGGLVRCRAAAHLLRSVGFSDVAILVQSSQ